MSQIAKQDPRRKLNLLLSIIILLVLSSFPLWVASQQNPDALNDDSLITLTYAKSLASGKGFVFNHPPASQGTTTPLFVIIVAATSILLPKITLTKIAIYLTAFCWLGLVWIVFFYRKSWGLTEWQSIIISLFLISTGWINYLGMEAYLFAFLLLFSLSVYHKGNFFLTGMLIGLLFLTRGEGILVFFVIVTHWLITEVITKKHIKAYSFKSIGLIVLGLSLPLCLWFIYSYNSFGYFLPNTLAAKIAQGQAGFWRFLPQRLSSEWVPAWSNKYDFLEFPIINGWWMLIAIGTLTIIFQKHKWLTLLLWGILYFMGYSVLKVAAYAWYSLPILFVLHVVAAIGLIKLTELLTTLSRNKFARYSGSVLAACLVVYIVYFFAKPTISFANNFKGDQRSTIYLNLCEWLNKNTKKTESVAFVETGYLGYYTSNKIIDLMGLTTPGITSHIATGDFAWAFWKYQPDYYIYQPSFNWALANINNNPNFSKMYQVAYVLPRKDKNNPLLVFKKRNGL